MADTEKPSEVQSATSKDENVEYNPVNMAGKKAYGVKKRDRQNSKDKVQPSRAADGIAVGNDTYNPVNMAGRKAGDMKDIDKYNVELDGGVDLYSVRRDQSQKGK